MSILNQQLHSLIQKVPKARERKHKNEAIGYLLKNYYGVDVSKEKMAEIVADALLLDREWRKFLEENQEYRGKDYEEKARLEQKKKVELGYAPQPLSNQFKEKMDDEEA